MEYFFIDMEQQEYQEGYFQTVPDVIYRDLHSRGLSSSVLSMKLYQMALYLIALV